MGLRGVDGYDALAAKIGYSYGTVKALMAGQRTVLPRHVQAIATGLEVDVAWFTVPDLDLAVKDYAAAVAAESLTPQSAAGMLERLLAGHAQAKAQAQREKPKPPADTDRRSPGREGAGA